MNIREAIINQGDYAITITQTLKGENQNCYIKTTVTGTDKTGDNLSYTNIDDDYDGADLSEIVGFVYDEPQITNVMLSASIDWFFWDDEKFRKAFCVSQIARKFL